MHALVDGRAHPDTHIPTLVRAGRAYVCSADVQELVPTPRSTVESHPTPTSIVRSTDLHNQHLWALLIENHVICTHTGMKYRRSHSNTLDVHCLRGPLGPVVAGTDAPPLLAATPRARSGCSCVFFQLVDPRSLCPSSLSPGTFASPGHSVCSAARHMCERANGNAAPAGRISEPRSHTPRLMGVSPPHFPVSIFRARVPRVQLPSFPGRACTSRRRGCRAARSTSSRDAKAQQAQRRRAVEFAALEFHGKLNVRSRGADGALGAPGRQLSDR